MSSWPTLLAAEEAEKFTLDEVREMFLSWRGVEYPCKKCEGSGVRLYNHSSTWHGGMGVDGRIWDVCSECWGSGDSTRSFVNLKELYKELWRKK